MDNLNESRKPDGSEKGVKRSTKNRNSRLWAHGSRKTCYAGKLGDDARDLGWGPTQAEWTLIHVGWMNEFLSKCPLCYFQFLGSSTRMLRRCWLTHREPYVFSAFSNCHLESAKLPQEFKNRNKGWVEATDACRGHSCRFQKCRVHYHEQFYFQLVASRCYLE